jgi:uncharacterized membrane protein
MDESSFGMTSADRNKLMKMLRAGCRAKGLVYDPKLDSCRQDGRRKSAGPAMTSAERSATMKALRAVCRVDGKVYDPKTKECRDSKRKSAGPAMTPAQRSEMMKAYRAACRVDGRVYDPKTKECRDSKRKSTGPAMTSAERSAIMKALRAACRVDGRVYDPKTKECRDSKRKSTGHAMTPAQRSAMMKAYRAACRVDGMVYDPKTKRCRDSKRKSGFGVTIASQAPGRMYASPSSLSSPYPTGTGLEDTYKILIPQVGQFNGVDPADWTGLMNQVMTNQVIMGDASGLATLTPTVRTALNNYAVEYQRVINDASLTGAQRMAATDMQTSMMQNLLDVGTTAAGIKAKTDALATTLIPKVKAKAASAAASFGGGEI